MINNGMFGTTAPIQPNVTQQPIMQYNPFRNQNNQIPFNSNPMMLNIGSEGYNKPKEDYYNPFPQYYPQNNYYNGYRPFSNYSPYYTPQPYISMSKREQMFNDQVELAKLKLRISFKMTNIEVSEDELDRLTNPRHDLNTNTKSEKELQRERDWRDIVSIVSFECNPYPIWSEELQRAKNMSNYLKVYHETLDSHSLCEFFEEDYPRMMREFWIEEKIKPNKTKDLSSTYNEDAYLELLGIHSESNPYLKKLLSTKDFSNDVKTSDGIKGIEMGIKELREFAEERQRAAHEKLHKIAELHQSKEIQEQRQRFMAELRAQVEEKSKRSNLPDNLITVGMKPASEVKPGSIIIDFG